MLSLRYFLRTMHLSPAFIYPLLLGNIWCKTLIKGIFISFYKKVFEKMILSLFEVLPVDALSKSRF